MCKSRYKSAVYKAFLYSYDTDELKSELWGKTTFNNTECGTVCLGFSGTEILTQEIQTYRNI